MLKTVLLYILAAIGYWVGTLINPFYVALFTSIIATLQAIGLIIRYIRVKTEQEKAAAYLLHRLFRSK